jgi:hypothetical protein
VETAANTIQNAARRSKTFLPKESCISLLYQKVKNCVRGPGEAAVIQNSRNRERR